MVLICFSFFYIEKNPRVTALKGRWGWEVDECELKAAHSRDEADAQWGQASYVAIW